MGSRRNGQAFIVVVVATIALLVFGLGVTSWFSTSHTALGYDVSASIRLASIELCVNNACQTTPTAFAISDTYTTAGFATLVIAVAFAAVLAWSLYTRITTGWIPRTQRIVGMLLAGLAIAMSLFCMLVVPPDLVAAEFPLHRYSYNISPSDLEIVGTPHLAMGGFVLILALVLGAALLHTGQPEPQPDEPDDDRRRPEPRREILAPPRGVETDPFRAPPAPPPVAVIKHERPATAPVELDPDDEPPKLLR